MATKYVDVNKENYMKALLTNLQKTNKMISLDERAKLIHDFVVGNPSNDSSKTKVRNGLILNKNGSVVIRRK